MTSDRFKDFATADYQQVIVKLERTIHERDTQLYSTRVRYMRTLEALEKAREQLVVQAMRHAKAQAAHASAPRGRPALTLEQRQQILALIDAGHRQCDVARLMRVSESTVSRLLQKARNFASESAAD